MTLRRRGRSAKPTIPSLAAARARQLQKAAAELDSVAVTPTNAPLVGQLLGAAVELRAAIELGPGPTDTGPAYVSDVLVTSIAALRAGKPLHRTWLASFH